MQLFLREYEGRSGKTATKCDEITNFSNVSTPALGDNKCGCADSYKDLCIYMDLSCMQQVHTLREICEDLQNISNIEERMPPLTVQRHHVSRDTRTKLTTSQLHFPIA